MDAQPPDPVLLRAFAAQRDERAFRTLVERYQNMVYSTARRRLGRDDMAAEVAQNVFAALARKAPWLSGRSSLGGWLYKSALLEAARRQRDEARRLNRHRLFAEEMKTQNPTSEPVADGRAVEMLPLLDAELAQLSAPDREAIILRYFRGLSLRETGAALGTTEEAARKRVTRAVEKLSRRFRRKGLAAPAAMLVSVLPKAIDAAPPALLSQVTSAAAASPGPGLAGTLYLKAVMASKAQAVAATLALTGLPVGWQWHQIRSLEQENAALHERLASASPPEPVPGLNSPPPAPLLADAPPAAPAAGRTEPSARQRPPWHQWWELQRQQQRRARLSAMREELGLDDTQSSIALQAMERADEARQALFQEARAERRRPDPEALASISSGLDETLRALMHEEQAPAWEQFRSEEQRNQQEIYASRMLGEVQGMLHLTDQQKDRLFEVFASQPGAGEGFPFGAPEAFDNLGPFQEILTEEQFEIWKQRTELWQQMFQPPEPSAERRGAGQGDAP